MTTPAPAAAAHRETYVSAGTAPTEPGARIEALDVIRGIAIFGLVWVHLVGDGQAFSLLDRVAGRAMWILGFDKFKVIFSFMFGVSLMFLMERAAAREEGFAARWLRRMLGLYLIGWIHAVFFSHVDVLRAYAVAGVLLLFFRHRSPRALLASAAVVLVLWLTGPSLSNAVTRLGGLDAAAMVPPEAARAAHRAGWDALGSAMENGSYLEVAAARARMLAGSLYLDVSRPPAGPLNLIPLHFLGLFLLGLYAARRRMVHEPERHLPLIRRVAWVGIGVGLPLSAFGDWIIVGSPPAWLTEPTALGLEYRWLVPKSGGVLLGLGYLAALLLMLRDPTWMRRLRPVGAVGRMGLTNYMLQSLFVATLFFGYGAGLGGRLGSSAAMVVALLFVGVQVLWSQWWLARFRFGPAEWLWRSWTCGRWQPMRIARPVTVAA